MYGIFHLQHKEARRELEAHLDGKPLSCGSDTIEPLRTDRPLRGVTTGRQGGHNSPGAESLWGRGMTVRAPKSPNNVTSTLFNTVHLLPKDLRFEHGRGKLAYCPGRHLTSFHPCGHMPPIPRISSQKNWVHSPAEFCPAVCCRRRLNTALLVLLSKTYCEMWLGAFAVHHRSICQCWRAPNPFKFATNELRCLLHAALWSMNTCSVSHFSLHVMRCSGSWNGDIYLRRICSIPSIWAQRTGRSDVGRGVGGSNIRQWFHTRRHVSAKPAGMPPQHQPGSRKTGFAPVSEGSTSTCARGSGAYRCRWPNLTSCLPQTPTLRWGTWRFWLLVAQSINNLTWLSGFVRKIG